MSHSEHPSGSANGNALLVPGLNNRISILDPLAAEFTQRGFSVTTNALAAHDGNVCAWRTQEAFNWVGGVSEDLATLKTARPLRIAVGYSLGASALLASIRANPGLAPDALILFAPAVKTTFRASLIRLVLVGRFLGFAVPSMAPPEFRIHRGTTLQAYHALFDLADQLAESEFPAILTSLPTLVVLFAGDELIDHEATIEWISSRYLPWKVVTITGKSDLPKHLGVHPTALGAEGWMTLQSEIDIFLGTFTQGHARQSSP